MPGPAEGTGSDPAGVSDDSSVLGSDVSRDREGWWVELTVGFADAAPGSPAEVVRSRVGPYLTERAAEVAAGLIARAAARRGPPPSGR